MGISALKTKIISEYEFKYGSSDNAVNLRKIYGNDGYKKYVAKQNSIMVKEGLTNPIAQTKEAYTAAKNLIIILL